MKKITVVVTALKKINFDLVFVALAMLLGLYLNWPIVYVGVLVFTVWMILKPIKNEILISIALVFVVLIPISQVAKDPTLTEGLGISVYILIITIIAQFILELFSNEKKRQNNFK